MHPHNPSGEPIRYATILLNIFNDSNHPAIKPHIVIQDLENALPNPKFRRAVKLRGNLRSPFGLENVSIPAKSSGVTEFDALSQLMMSESFDEVNEIGEHDSGLFTLGLAFEKGELFYFFVRGGGIVLPLGTKLRVQFGVGAQGLRSHPFMDFTCTLSPEAWNRVVITDDKGNEL